MRTGFAAGAVMTAVLSVTACSSAASPANPSGGLSGSVTVFAASSLTEAFTAMAEAFEKSHPGTTITFSYDASSALATRIIQGKRGDVFASASVTSMKSVAKAGDAVHPSPFAGNTMEIATPPGNRAKIATVGDLGRPGVKVALCEVAVPCGSTAAQVFDNAHVTVRPVSREADVKSTLAKVELKEVDAGVVYVTDVRAAGAKVTGVPIPSDVNAGTVYPISVLKGSKNAALAQAWVGYVLSAAGRRALQAAGFSLP